MKERRTTMHPRKFEHALRGRIRKVALLGIAAALALFAAQAHAQNLLLLGVGGAPSAGAGGGSVTDGTIIARSFGFGTGNASPSFTFTASAPKTYDAVVMLRFNGGATLLASSYTDSAGNTWTVGTRQVTTALSTYILYSTLSANPIAGGTTTLTLSTSEGVNDGWAIGAVFNSTGGAVGTQTTGGTTSTLTGVGQFPDSSPYAGTYPTPILSVVGVAIAGSGVGNVPSTNGGSGANTYTFIGRASGGNNTGVDMGLYYVRSSSVPLRFTADLGAENNWNLNWVTLN